MPPSKPSRFGLRKQNITSPATGDIYCRDSNGDEKNIAAGTSGHVLTSNGAGAEPSYQAVSGGGGGGVSSGTSFPGSPSAWDLFVLDTTGREVLFQYDGSAWNPIISYGSFTVYVDGTSGTDSQAGGTATGASAFATIQYAIDQIPPLYSGNVTINISADTYNEDVAILGKTPTGNYSITIQGAETTLDSITASSGVQGTGATQGSVTRNSGTWTSNQRQDKWIKGTSGNNNGIHRVIDSNTSTVATICGNWDGSISTSDTFEVYEPATIVDSILIKSGQTSVNINTIKMTGTSGMTITEPLSQSVWNYLWVDAGSTQNHSWDGKVSLQSCLSSQTRNNIQFNFEMRNSKVDRGDGSDAIRVRNKSFAKFQAGNVFDGSSSGTAIGVEASSTASFTLSSSFGYNRIRNWTTGIDADQGGNANTVSQNQYSGNTTNENANATEYSYIG